jgi:hypothetical protein
MPIRQPNQPPKNVDYTDLDVIRALDPKRKPTKKKRGKASLVTDTDEVGDIANISGLKAKPKRNKRARQSQLSEPPLFDKTPLLAPSKEIPEVPTTPGPKHTADATPKPKPSKKKRVKPSESYTSLPVEGATLVTAPSEVARVSTSPGFQHTPKPKPKPKRNKRVKLSVLPAPPPSGETPLVTGNENLGEASTTPTPTSKPDPKPNRKKRVKSTKLLTPPPKEGAFLVTATRSAADISTTLGLIPSTEPKSNSTKRAKPSDLSAPPPSAETSIVSKSQSARRRRKRVEVPVLCTSPPEEKNPVALTTKAVQGPELTPLDQESHKVTNVGYVDQIAFTLPESRPRKKKRRTSAEVSTQALACGMPLPLEISPTPVTNPPQDQSCAAYSKEKEEHVQSAVAQYATPPPNPTPKKREKRIQASTAKVSPVDELPPHPTVLADRGGNNTRNYGLRSASSLSKRVVYMANMFDDTAYYGY